MKVWALYHTNADGGIPCISGVTTDAETAAIWEADNPLYVAEEFDTDDARCEVMEILAMNANARAFGRDARAKLRLV